MHSNRFTSNSRVMRLLINALSLLVVVIGISVTSAQNADTCQACNCQFNNVQALKQLVAAVINEAQINEPCKCMGPTMGVIRQGVT